MLTADAVDIIAEARDRHLAAAHQLTLAADRLVACLDPRAELRYVTARHERMLALVAQRRLDAAAGNGRWATLADLRGGR